MTRRRPVPWIHQYSRLLIGATSILGIGVTTYLTWVKLGNDGVCGSEGCQVVLTSPYANVGDFPLTGLGLLSYIAVMIMAFAPMVVSPKTNKAAHNRLNDLSWWGLLLVSVGMAVFSSYLMYLLAFVIKAACPFCIASAIFTFAIAGLTIVGHDWADLGQAIFLGIAAALFSLLVSIVFYSTAVPQTANGGAEITSLAPTKEPTPGIGWEIKSTSTVAEIELAKHLTRKGAKMYSAYWCPHCYEQKQLFGKQAWAEVTSVECAADAKNNPQPDACAKAGIKGFPTWIIDGKLEPGVKELAKLGELTGYTANTVFKYDKLFTR